jgi:type II secretory pathway component PulF
MTKYSYRAITGEGASRNGSIEAPSEAQAARLLQQNGLVVLSISEGEAADGLGSASQVLRGRIGSQQLVEFATESSALLDAKIPLEQVLKTQADLCTHDRFKEVLTAVWQDVNGGASFADALARHPKVFERFFVNMVRGGEVSGALELIMRRVAALLEHRAKLRAKIIGALIYPSLLVIMGIVVMAAMMFFLVPMLSEMFGDGGEVLPFSTRMIIAQSEWFRDWWLLFPIAGAGLFTMHKLRTRSEEGQVNWGLRILKLPLLGTLIAQAETSRFCRMLGALLDGQVPILQAISITGGTLGNAALRSLMRDAASCVQAGQPMGPLLIQRTEFPELAARMIMMGEESGELHVMLGKVADRYEEKVSATTDQLVSVIEPIFIIIMGVGVGFIVVGMMQGIMAMSTAAG